ncbi:MAG TPA: hypothetical protein VKH35_14255 [Thermoanaerobaculia bacterium]|nr:hypothetical protein [Thermoanaerobaculia bacterium]
MQRWRVAILSLLLFSAVAASLPRLADSLRLAARLLPLSLHERREALMPEFYANIEKLRSSGRRPVAVLATTRAALDQAVFLTYYLYPREAKTYGTRFAWAALDPKTRPSLIVDAASARVTTYAAVRDADLRREPLLRDPPLPPATRRSFAIPIVSSNDGMPAAAYVIEGALAADVEAHVTLTLFPNGIPKTLTVRGKRTFYDLVYECFGVMQFAGWMRVESDAPVRAAFWLVNQPAHVAAPLHLVSGPLESPAHFPALPHPAILWLLNLSDRPVVGKVASHDAPMPPHALYSIDALGTVGGPIYAFITAKLPDGNTRFIWPEDVP